MQNIFCATIFLTKDKRFFGIFPIQLFVESIIVAADAPPSIFSRTALIFKPSVVVLPDAKSHAVSPYSSLINKSMTKVRRELAIWSRKEETQLKKEIIMLSFNRLCNQKKNFSRLSSFLFLESLYLSASLHTFARGLSQSC